MDYGEWTAIVPIVCTTWIAIDEAEALGWGEGLADLDGGLVTSALIRMEVEQIAPSPASIRKMVNQVVRDAVAAAPHPATTGYIDLDEWLHRGCPGFMDGEENPHTGEVYPREPDRDKVRAIALLQRAPIDASRGARVAF